MLPDPFLGTGPKDFFLEKGYHGEAPVGRKLALRLSGRDPFHLRHFAEVGFFKEENG